jgi:hypothetical protein
MKTTVKSQTYYKFPSYHGLCIDFLKQSKVDVYNFFAKKTHYSIHKYGMTICSNGWDNVTRHPLLTMMFVYHDGDVFVMHSKVSAYNYHCHHTHNT